MKNNKIKYLQRLLYLTFTEIYGIIREKNKKGGTGYDQNDIDVGINIFRWFYRRPSNHKIYAICCRKESVVRNPFIGFNNSSELWCTSIFTGRWSKFGTQYRSIWSRKYFRNVPSNETKNIRLTGLGDEKSSPFYYP